RDLGPGCARAGGGGEGGALDVGAAGLGGDRAAGAAGAAEGRDARAGSGSRVRRLTCETGVRRIRPYPRAVPGQAAVRTAAELKPPAPRARTSTAERSWTCVG